MQVTPGERRSVVERIGMDYQLSIPGRIRIFVLIFLLAWLGLWTTGGLTAAQAVGHSWQKGEIEWFLIFWMAGWVLGECLVLLTVAYMIAGTETIVIRARELSIRTSIFGLGLTREYDASQIRRLRVEKPTSRKQLLPPMIAFDYGAKTVGFGRDLDEAEAQTIVTELTATGFLPNASVH